MVDSAIEANLLTIISNTHHSWHFHPKCALQGHGVMLLQKNFKLEGLKWCFLEHIIAQNSSFWGVFFFGGGGGAEGRAWEGCIIRLG